MSAPAKTAKLSRLLPALPVVLALCLLVYHPSWLAAAENWLFDGLARRTSPPASGDVVIIAIDDASLAAHGRWPWTRQKTGALVRALTASRPAAVALAMMFPEPSTDDAGFASAVASGRVIGGYSFEFTGAENTTAGCGLTPLPEELGKGEGLLAAHAATCNVAPIAATLAGSGFLNAAPDADGFLRRIPLLAAHGGRIYPSFALAAAMGGWPMRVAALRRESAGPWNLLWNSELLRLGASGELLPRLRPHTSFARYPAAAVLAGEVPAQALEGRLVLVGLTARGFGDERVTAFGPSYSGVDIHASVVDNLLHGGGLAPLGGTHSWEALLILAAGVGTALLLARRRPLPATLAVVASGVAMAALTPAVFAWTGTFLSPYLSLGAMGGSAAVMGVLRGRAHRDRNERISGDLKMANDFMLAALTSITMLRHEETGAHLERVQQVLRLLCDALRVIPKYENLLRPDVVQLLVAVAPIHDIGKVGIPDYILHKTGSLTEEEMALIREHVHFGRRVLEAAREKSGLRNAALFEMCQSLVYSHHERWDGTGYPDGLRGDAIPLPARLLAVVDVYDAMVTRRVYKPALPHDVVVKEIAAARGVLFDPDIVDAFLAQHEKFREVYAEGPNRAAATNA